VASSNEITASAAASAAAEIAFNVEESPTRKGNTDLITFD
jgi:hypothetical protein